MVKVVLHIDYRTNWGQTLQVSGNLPILGDWDAQKALSMRHVGGEHWQVSFEVEEAHLPQLSYKYLVKETKQIQWEFGKNRTLPQTIEAANVVEIRDYWRPTQLADNVFQTNAFTQAMMKPNLARVKPVTYSTMEEETAVIFQINAPRVLPNQIVGVLGNDESLGAWDEEKVVLLNAHDYPKWNDLVAIKNTNQIIEYKYVLVDADTKRVTEYETGDNRVLSLNLNGALTHHLFIQSDEVFRYNHNWRAAGVAIPVFSLRSTQSNGVGEFTDLKLLIDWAKKTGLKMVQVLPVNDTVANHTWTDSYPYAAISVFALHPMYVNLQTMGKLQDADAKVEYEEKRTALNLLTEVDYEGVMQLKSWYFKKLYDQEKENLTQNADFHAFIDKNASWLKPYAAFSHLRDLYNTPDFGQWKLYSKVTWEDVLEICDEADEHYQHIEIHYFIQYHAHLQLLGATEYARKNGMILKGDLPIGIYRYSCDAWISPQLYNMNGQAGAPPDAFAVTGQNWGFPTYNWEVMAKDGYQWWKDRFAKLATYFDALRIDHILGFFRIWEIPYEQIEGLLGVFRPALPIMANELRERGINLDYQRLVNPYIREHFLYQIFENETDWVKQNLLEHLGNGIYQLKFQVNSQREVEAFLLENIIIENRRQFIQKGVFELINEVLFIESQGGFHPRISIHSARSFKELDVDMRSKIDALYTDYFFHRQNEFWSEQAMKKLPVLVNATDMLICGEDLGMIPASVPGVMKELNILSLEIQRMPKGEGEGEFGHPDQAPYLSVVSPSSHDMSTVRGWWEEDRAATQRFFNQILLNQGDAPYYCEPWVCKQVVEQHLYSPAMWAVFPIQDLVALDNGLRRVHPQEEQINVPANPKHYWRYRFHLNLEDLLKATSLNNLINGMVTASGR